MSDINGGDRIHCVFSTDNNYCQHLAVTLVSLLENDETSNLFIHIVHSDIVEANMAKLTLIFQKYPSAAVAFYKFDASAYSHFRLDYHITLASYFRLFLTDILPSDVTKLIYLDCDLVVLVDLRALWDLNLEGKLIAAAPDLFMPDNARLGLPSNYCYFNAGVLVINLAGWRANNLIRTFVEYVEKESAILRFHDQDTLNVILQDSVKYLDLSWNFQARLKPEDVAQIGLSPEQYRALHKAPKIVHFTTRHKPWFYRPKVAFENKYTFYLRKTPWRDYVPPDRTIGNVIKRRIKQNIPWLVNAFKGSA
jgi:lipopolysaccharide biosynthesis glycosyltransferase